MVTTLSVRALSCPAPSLLTFSCHKFDQIPFVHLRRLRKGVFDTCTIRISYGARHNFAPRPSVTCATKDGELDEIDAEEIGISASVAMDRGATLAPAGRQQEVWIVRAAVDALTEGLRWLGVQNRSVADVAVDEADMAPPSTSAGSLVQIIREDYEERAYFVTGMITESAYDDECFFGDPTISFTGRAKWKRNIQLLVPFFEDPSIHLLDIREGEEVGGRKVIETKWRLKTYLGFPWKPLIDVKGGTTHTLDSLGEKVVRHVESWEVSGLGAIAQMFVPSERAVWRKRR